MRNRLLVYHGIGSGKTCSALSVAEKWIDHRQETIKKGKLPRVLFIVPQSVISSVVHELLFICGSNKRHYLKKSDLEKLKNAEPGSTEYKSLIKKAEDNISVYYELGSLTYSTIKKVDFNNRLVIIDEAHNMLYDPNISGKDKPPKIFEYTLRKVRMAEILRKKNLNEGTLNKTDFTLLLMTATPLYNSVLQLASLVKLLVYPDTDSVTIPKLINEFIEFPFKPSSGATKSFYATPAAKTKQDAILHNKTLLEKILKGYISYYSGVGKTEKNVPGYPDITTKKVHLDIIGFQLEVYNAIVHGKSGASLTTLPLKVRGKIEEKYKDIKKQKNVLTSNIGYQKICNIAFSKSDIKLIAKNKGKSYKELLKVDKTLPTISIKFNQVIKTLEKAKRPNFIYSNFIQHGVKEFVTCLRANGYHKYKPGKNKKNKKYYAVITGSTDKKTKRAIIDAYNKKSNKNGNIIKVLVGSSTLKEGVNLLRTDQVHLLEPYWNESQSIQAIGRARRFCSHKDVKPPKGKPNPIVTVYRYTVAPKGSKSADVKMAERSTSKSGSINNTENVFKFIAIDCIMNKEANTNDNIKCPN